MYLPARLWLCGIFLLCGCEQRGQDTVSPSHWDNQGWNDEQIRLLERGRQLYLQKCAACHQADGTGTVSLGAPALNGSAVVTGPVETHIEIVLKGRANGTMPAYRNILSDAALAALISYERNAWSNRDPGLVTAEQVRARKTAE